MITTGFLHVIAEIVDGKIAKVVINGTYEITDFEVKSVAGGKVALNYMVRAADVSNINLIEVKDSMNNVISSNSVDIPITTDHMMVQSIEVKEGTT